MEKRRSRKRIDIILSEIELNKLKKKLLRTADSNLYTEIKKTVLKGAEKKQIVDKSSLDATLLLLEIKGILSSILDYCNPNYIFNPSRPISEFSSEIKSQLLIFYNKLCIQMQKIFSYLLKYAEIIKINQHGLSCNKIQP